MNYNERRTYFKQFDRKRASYLVWARNVYKRAFRKQFTEWNRTGILPPEPMQAAYKLVWSRVGQDFAVETARSIETGRTKRITATQNDYRASLMAYLATEGAGRVTGVNDTTIEKLRQIVERATQQGLGIDETKRLITAEFNFMVDYRAERIARTEIIGASNRAAYEAGKATGMQLKKIWIATLDDRTRESHREMDGHEIDMNDNFIVDGSPMETPGDVNAPLDQIVQCRCTIAFVPVDSTPF